MTPQVQELLEMLTYRRPGGSETEKLFIDKYLAPLKCEQDAYGNIFKTIGKSDVIWSSHIDTVHTEQGIQKVVVGHDFVTAEGSNCLGADCTTGVWLMVNMIRNNVPGIYIFHRDEETGCGGSKYVSKTYDEGLRKKKAAIAFDRYGYTSIITHQMGRRTCSEDFSKSLTEALGLSLRSDDGGMYTDTYQYASQIPECTNISVGYFNQHTERESQDTEFAEILLDQLLKFDESKLICVRDPSVIENNWGHYGGFYGYGGDDEDWIDSYYQNKYHNRAKTSVDKLHNLAETIRMYPEEAASILLAHGYTEDDIIGTAVRSY